MSALATYFDDLERPLEVFFMAFSEHLRCNTSTLSALSRPIHISELSEVAT